MELEYYLNKNVFDDEREKYYISELVESYSYSAIFKTDNDDIVKMGIGSHFKKYYEERYNWLETLKSNKILSKYLELPKGILKGLKYNEYGYVYGLSEEQDLTYYINCDYHSKLLNWYFEETGGIEYRLKLGYALANALENVHKFGYCLTDLCPQNIEVSKYNPESPNDVVVKFKNVENMTSYSYSSILTGCGKYYDPLVFLNRNTNSVSSDTYSFAIVLFELLTTCLPFEGDDIYLDYVDAIERMDSGALPFIGDWNSEENKNERYEMSENFLSNDLNLLFYKMFVDGKLDKSKRPTILDFKKACLKAMHRIVKSSKGDHYRDYIYNDKSFCPIYANKPKNFVIAKAIKETETTEKILMPYDNQKRFSTLPLLKQTIDFMIIKPGFNKVPKSFFDPTIENDNGSAGIWIQYSPDVKKLRIRNCFKQIKIQANNKVLSPYVDDSKTIMSDCIFTEDEKIIISLPENVMLSTEQIANLNFKEYGNVKQQIYLAIDKE